MTSHASTIPAPVGVPDSGAVPAAPAPASSSGRRNHALDFVKGVACIAVVFMHCEFPGRLGTLVQCLVRFAVPFFFMVSGYFCFRPQTIGLKYSLFVYILHPAAWHWLDRVYAAAGIATHPVVGYLRPLLCAAVALLASMALGGIRSACLNRMRGNP